MEFSERKRSRKSQSFKLVNQDYQHHYVSDTNGGSRDTQYSSGDESLEIKKQITGMRRLLNDSTGRIYQRVGKEGDQLKEERQDLDISWAEGLSIPSAAEEPIQPSQSSWSEVPIPTPDYTGQYGTRSKTVQNHVKNTGSNGGLKMGNSLSSSKCCTCNCQPTLQAILQELKAMRKFMQVQADGGLQRAWDVSGGINLSVDHHLKPSKNRGTCKNKKDGGLQRAWDVSGVAQSRQQIPPSCACSQKTIASRKRITKKKVLPKTLSSSPLNSTHSIPEKEHRDHRPALLPERSGLSEIEHVKKEEDHVLGFGIVVNSSSSDPEVQLAEGFDVFMPKSQLDSILSNYKRSGSLLFRKLVCAFFDDKTLATSLPNGKRKRGLNDNRQGLDQNIVGAIKVFTEKYCTANNVEKVPGPRHWVQILQDQIKLARRRLKRGCDLGRSSQVI